MLNDFNYKISCCRKCGYRNPDINDEAKYENDEAVSTKYFIQCPSCGAITHRYTSLGDAVYYWNNGILKKPE